MHVLMVHIHVKPEFIEPFKEASLANARGSIQESGVLRFDVLQQVDDPTRFSLYEVYRAPEDHAKHRETAHYLTWKDTVTEMMADARQGIRFTNLFPDDQNWNKE
jgi:autoinducer 2-degrading protein